MLHGYLGVGKTTLAKRLEQQCRAVRFSHDDWMSRLYGADPPASRFPDYAERVSGLLEQVWTRCLAAGCSVVLDFGFWSRAERVRVRSLIANCGAEPILHRLSCPDDLAWQRICGRNDRLDGSLHIAPSTYAALKARFEPIGPDEPLPDVEHDQAG